MSIVPISAIAFDELPLLGNNVIAQVEAESDFDIDAINRSLQTWDEQLDEAVLS